MKVLRVLASLVAFIIAMNLWIGCPPPPPPPPPKDACESVSIPAIAGPASGSQVICTLPSECREDMVVVPIDDLLCNDKSKASCPAGSNACKTSCGGTVLSSGLAITPNSCSWDRNSECKTASGAAGSNCTCKWTIPAGSSLACGCACQ